MLIALATGGAQTAAVAAPRAATNPVSGGGGFADAPLLDAGIHTDTLLPRETLFYAVALRAGQRLRVHAKVDVSVGSRGVQDIPDASSGFLQVALFTPLRQRLPSHYAEDDEIMLELESRSAEAESPRVLSAAAAGRAAARDENWTGPGVYHLAVVLSEITRDLGATVELPLRLAIDIDGPSGPAAATARTSQGPLGDPRAGPTPDDRTEARSDGVAAASLDTGLVVGGAAAALLLGASAGYLGAARRSP